MNRVLPVFVALLAVLVIVAPAAGADGSVSIPDRTVSPDETVEITPDHENVRALRIRDIPGEWGVSVDGDIAGTSDTGETTEAKWVEPGASASMTLTIPDSASGTYDLRVIAFVASEGDPIEKTFTITVGEESEQTDDESGGLAGGEDGIETTTTDPTPSGGADTTEAPDDDTTTDRADNEATDRADDTTTDSNRTTETPTPVPVTTENGPGFGVAAALLALAALIARRQ